MTHGKTDRLIGRPALAVRPVRRQQGQGAPPGVVDDDALAVPEVVPRGHEEGQSSWLHICSMRSRVVMYTETTTILSLPFRLSSDTAELFREFNKRVKLVDAPQAQYLADFAWNIALDAFNQYESEAAHNLMLCTAYIISKLSDRPFNLGETELEEYTYRQAVALLLAVASLTTCAPNVKTESEETRKERERMNISRSKAAMAQLRVILKNKTSETKVQIAKRTKIAIFTCF